MLGGSTNNLIAFVDTEIEPNSGKILDIGAINKNGNSFHSSSVADLIKFLKGTQFVCGHNILNHDFKYIGNALLDAGVKRIVDTLYLSPLLFPSKPYHALLKDDKLQIDELNNPLNDSIKAKNLFYDEIAAFQQIENAFKRILFALLKDQKEFRSFFIFLEYSENEINIESCIRDFFHSQICEQANIKSMILESPVELAYCLALIHAKSVHSITPPWVLNKFPKVENLMFLLRNNPCLEGCSYCNEALDAHKGLKHFFGFDSFRTFSGEPLQENAVRAALANKSLLAVFPTGGGKSITFQIPALMSGVNSTGLTVIISPLQSLMKDQVDNLEKSGITDAVTINGLLDPIERAKSFERVENGSATILYISPESLRSKSIERLLLKRNVVRFVIDEAHCFSSWGQAFRVDYLYIGDFIKSLQKKKNLESGIPVSCFTATAKLKVIDDICIYFKDKLSLSLEVINSNSSRTNLRYQVLNRDNENEKYNTLRDLIEEKKCPTIIYVSRTKKANDLADRLTADGYLSKPYHGKMDKQEKSDNQDAFINGEVQIIVATTAFGMGVDKKDIGMVIHFDISDSLENYIQEAGRAGRDESISANCFVLYNESDLDNHFLLLNQSKISIKEIQQIWKAIKDLTGFRSRMSKSALEIAREAGWNENMFEVETRVKTAIAALEEAGYIKRGQNMPRIFADSILSKNAQEAIAKIDASNRFDDNQKLQAHRIIVNLIAKRSRKMIEGEDAEGRVDYISDRLGIVTADVIKIVNLLREEKILADTMDLTAFIKRRDSKNRSLNILLSFCQIERFLSTVLNDEQQSLSLKQLNQQAEENGCKDVNPSIIKTILNFWAIKSWIKRQTSDSSKDYITITCLQKKDVLDKMISTRNDLAQFVVEYLYDKCNQNAESDDVSKEETAVEFSVLELKEAFENRISLFRSSASLDEIEDTLFYLSRINALVIEGGFLVLYNTMDIERIEKDNKIRYKVDDYQKLNEFYQNKIQQIHIVGEYARRMISDYKDALQFVNDYFQLNYSSFIRKYFKGNRENEIKMNITPTKFKKLFGELSAAQLRIIKDNETKYIVVAAGPGSGKTRILVHKLASLLLMEDVKYEQLLMLTFSRSAATEFKKRLLKLINNSANYVEIKTFHSYCFDLLGRVGNLDKSDEIVQEAIKRIKAGEVESGRITKTVLVIDEAQDMDSNEFELVTTLMAYNEDMRVIAVGDDDQNIYEFRHSDSKYLEALINDKEAVKHELVENFRSKKNLVVFSNQVAEKINHRLKQTPIQPVTKDNGKIRLIQYRNTNLTTPLVNDILSEDLSGTTCVLTKTNEEALQITGLLLKNGVRAKLIQSNESFSLYNIVEIRYILEQLRLSENVAIINDDVWLNAKQALKRKYNKSSNFEACEILLKNFEESNPKYRYKTDLEDYIRESKLDDFVRENIETVFVSTIHKAKGREFDNVFIMLDQFNLGTDEAVRQLYVAITRSKSNLTIHYNGNYLAFAKAEEQEVAYDTGCYQQPNQLALQLNHGDVFLDYFIARQNLIMPLISGDELQIDGYFCCNANGKPVLKFSKQLVNQIEALKQKNYILKTAKIRFIVYWQKENSESETRIILPELHFERTGPDFTHAL